MPSRFALLLSALALLAPAAAVQAADEIFVTAEGAIRGYDAVAYHRDSRPVLGQAKFVHDWKGAQWHFASAENRDRFAADPERYAPAFGGYCAYGTSQGYKVSTQPEAFAVIDGRLYLNYNLPVQVTWNKDRAGYIAKAKSNWQTLESEAYTSGQ